MSLEKKHSGSFENEIIASNDDNFSPDTKLDRDQMSRLKFSENKTSKMSDKRVAELINLLSKAALVAENVTAVNDETYSLIA